MKIIDFLRKVGILRVGTRKYKQDKFGVAPPEAFVDDEFYYNSDKKKSEHKEEIKSKDQNQKKRVSVWKKILGGLVVFILLLIALVMWATSGMSDVANEFFIHVKTKHYKDAYNLTSSDFKGSTSLDAFSKFIQSNRLDEYKDSSWSERSINGKVGILKGVITLKNGDNIPIVLQFVKSSNDEWKILGIKKDRAGINETDEEKNSKQTSQQTLDIEKITTLPSDEKLVELTQNTTLVFGESVNAKDMSKLYNASSKTWQKQITVDKLNRVFTSVFNTGLDFTILKGIKPVIDKKSIENSGAVIVLKGHYPTTPTTIYFEYSYVKESGEFKLLGVAVNTKPIK